jgi:hypothetical protein
MEWSGFLRRHPRTAIGWNQDHVFLVQVDGRQSGLSVGMTFPELAKYFLKLGCRDAINLDGGGSATMWVLGQVMNSPSRAGNVHGQQPDGYRSKPPSEPDGGRSGDSRTVRRNRPLSRAPVPNRPILDGLALFTKVPSRNQTPP